MDNNIKYSVEVLAIIECSKVNPSKEIILSCCSTISDWSFFIFKARSHGIFPLVFKNLKELKKIIPSKYLEEMLLINLEITKQNMLMTSELINLTKYLESNSINVLSFKGPTLSQMAYKSILSRQFGDLDLIVEKKDLKKVYGVLILKGYSTNLNISFLDNELFLEKESDIEFFNKTNGITIELHWKLFRNQFSKITDDFSLFKNTSFVNINNFNIKVLENEVLLVYLCMHGSKHCWERIEWVSDIDRIIRNFTLDWNHIVKLSNIFKANSMLNLGLFFSNYLYNTKLPNDVLKNLDINIYLNLVNKSALHRSNITNIEDESKKTFELLKFHYHLNIKTYDKCKFIIGNIFKLRSGDIKNINLPKYLFFIYYIIKPIRIIKTYILKKLTKSI